MNTSQIREASKEAVKKAVQICGSQVALAKRAEITQGAVSKYIRGDASPTGFTARKLSKAVDGAIQPSEFAPHIFDSEAV